jgi:hypothetical protein
MNSSIRQVLSSVTIALAATCAVAQGVPESTPQTSIRVQTQPSVTRTPKNDFGSQVKSGNQAELRQAILADAREAQRRMETEAIQVEARLRAFTATAPPADQQTLQRTCAALARDPSNAAPRRALQKYVAEHRGQSPDAIAAYCVYPAYQSALNDVRATVGRLDQQITVAATDQTEVADALQRAQEHLAQLMSMISNLMKTVSDSTQTIIQNLR